LVFNSYTDHSAGGPAVQSAVNAARANAVMGSAPSVGAPDVTFLNDASGQPNRVQVQVYRVAARSNAVPTLIGPIFGVPTVNITAIAVGEASPANAELCVKPWTVPDKWIEMQTPPWSPSATFSAFPKSPTLRPDIYIPADQAGYTGYNATTDRGLQVVLKAGTGNNIAPSFYNAIDLPGSRGGADYRANIADCNPAVMHIGDLMTAEPGNMVGPTKQGTNDLVAKDPSAYWDSANGRVVSSMHPSPRIVVIPLYDPYYYDSGKHNGKNASLKLANFLGFFVEGVQGNGDVTGRIVPVPGLVSAGAPPPAGAFPRAIRLVQ
ncbi:MAG TPA: hypothetical protein VGY57_07375, partial [Vicinamibacterales bacterium]|nr:hypothetical protein [Vicinamibacterales bacterium]